MVVVVAVEEVEVDEENMLDQKTASVFVARVGWELQRAKRPWTVLSWSTGVCCGVFGYQSKEIPGLSGLGCGGW